MPRNATPALRPNFVSFGFALLWVAGLCCAAPSAWAVPQLYWVQTDNPAVGHVNADGSASPSTLPRADFTIGLAVANQTKQVYWYENTGRIMRGDAQLNNVTPVVTGLPTSGLLNLAVDPAHDLVF